MSNSNTPILDLVKNPKDLRGLKPKPNRTGTRVAPGGDKCSIRTGGHLGAGLGVVELTIALHYVYQTPYDKLIWDVGRSLIRKIINYCTDRIKTLRQTGAIWVYKKSGKRI